MNLPQRLFPLLVLSGCTTIGTVPPPTDWPTLAITERWLPKNEVEAICGKYAPHLMTVRGCAVIHFGSMTCDVYVSRVSTDSATVSHERAHCAGWDHHGETHLADEWRKWKETAPR